MISEGRYKAKPSDWKITKIGKNETPCIQVAMQVQVENETVELVWTGFFTDKARTRAVEALKLMGLTKENQVNLAKGTIGKSLDVTKEVIVVVDHEVLNGKTYPRIKWINPVSNFSKMSPPSVSEGQAILDSLGLAADLIEMDQKHGLTSESDLPV